MDFRCGIPPYVLLVREASKASKTIQALIIPLGCLPEPGGKTLQKTPYTFYCKIRRNQVETELESSSCWPDFIVTEDVVHAIM